MPMSKRAKKPSGSSAPISLEERYGSLFENAGEGIFQTSVSGRILNVNPALARSFGYRSPGEMKRNIKAAYRQVYADRNLREKILRRVEAESRHGDGVAQRARREEKRGVGPVAIHGKRTRRLHRLPAGDGVDAVLCVHTNTESPECMQRDIHIRRGFQPRGERDLAVLFGQRQREEQTCEVLRADVARQREIPAREPTRCGKR